jgi:RNA recognition motif-containing protein
VSNAWYSVAQLQVAFAAFTGVRAIRLVRDRIKKSRGFAFIEFVDVDVR